MRKEMNEIEKKENQLKDSLHESQNQRNKCKDHCEKLKNGIK